MTPEDVLARTIYSNIGSNEIARDGMNQMTRKTASAKLSVLRLGSVLDLFVTHLRMRAISEAMDPNALERAAHEINDLATEVRRRLMRNQRS